LWRRSLRFQLVIGLLLPLSAVALLQLAVAYQTAHAIAGRVTDTLLLASARSIAEHVSFGEGGIEAVVPPSALGIFDLGYGDRVFYRVETSEGRLLAGYPELPVPTRRTPSDPEYVNTAFHGEAIRMVSVTQPIATPAKTIESTIVVAETTRGETAMSGALWRQNGGQQMLLVLVALLVVWFSLRRGLAPVLRLSEEVGAREPDDYRAFSAGALQTELRPLVTSLNAHMERLRKQMDAQRRFTANAAHQLRTPLALLRTQASYALRAGDGERQEAARAIQSTTNQLARMVNQLLSLARSERAREATRFEPIDLVAMTREILEEQAPRALEHGLDVSFDSTSSQTDGVLGDRASLRDLVSNLVDNAIRYTPAGGSLAVNVDESDDGWHLLVGDTGPGIPPEDRAMVFERFYRRQERDAEGSGLGLAIVKEIVETHGATIALRAQPEGTGLVVDVCFARRVPELRS
jgi:two-component system sensor histidine kinase TctE